MSEASENRDRAIAAFFKILCELLEVVKPLIVKSVKEELGA